MSGVKFTKEFLDNYLTCHICKKKFVRPKALPCLHTFCQQCLERYISVKHVPVEGVFNCLTCQKQTVYPTTRSGGFPDNHLIISLTDLLENKTKSLAAAHKTGIGTYRLDHSVTEITDIATDSDNPSTSINNFDDIQASPGNSSDVDLALSTSQDNHQVEAHDGPGKYLATSPEVTPINPPPYNPKWHPEEEPPPYGAGESPPANQSFPLSLFDQSAAFMHDPHMIACFGQYGLDNHQLTFPLGLTTIKDHIIISDQRDNRILVFNHNGHPLSVFRCKGNIHCIIGSPTGMVVVATTNVGSALAISYNLSGIPVKYHGNLFSHENPFGITLTPNGDIVTADLESCCINSITTNGKLKGRFNKRSTMGRKVLHTPFHIGYMPHRDLLLISDSEANNIKMFKISGEYISHFGGEFGKPSQLCHPRGICVDCYGNIIVADFGHHCVRVFDPFGHLQTTLMKYPPAENAQNTLRPINVTLSADNKLIVLVVAFGFAQVRIYNYEPVNFAASLVSKTCSIL